MKRMLARVFLTSLLVSAAFAQQKVWEQCGGKTWTGTANCAAGTVCEFKSEWYSQCVPATTTSASPSPKSTSVSPSPKPTSPSPVTSPKTSPVVASPVNVPSPSVVISIDASTKYQTIDGFGGINLSNNWGSGALSTSVIDTAFGKLGFTIMRVRIPPNKSDWNSNYVASIKAGLKYPNVKVFASIWSPPASMKTNNNLVSGSLSTSQYSAYASFLQSFVDFLKTNGIDLYGIAIQNEPDIKVSYESCDWTASQLLDFAKNYAGKITGTKVISAESFHFDRNYYDPILNDATAVQNIDIIAGHIYGGGLSSYPLATSKGKPIWMTEHFLNDNLGWDETLKLAQEINSCMTSGWSAYIYWYIQRFYAFIGDGSNGTTSGAILPRGYMMSQFAKYVLPGYVRISASSSSSDLKFSAYTGSGKTATVIINPTTKSVVTSLKFSQVSKVESAYFATESSAPTSISTAISGQAVYFTVPAKSVGTIVIS
ncbi:Endo-1,4-beta-xylanase, putative, xyn5A [Nowakowskiella sp. JEL0407]|nr:Endo-1,4-beta-xylanase, putative, xyn5A [Nowakowskiella sp. JEL0407]